MSSTMRGLRECEVESRIVDNRLNALRMGTHLLRRWGVRLPRDEVMSAVDLALCEAARRYDPSSRASFLTYAFYYIRGELIGLIKESKRSSLLLSERGAPIDDEGYESLGGARDDDDMQSPMDAVHASELRKTMHGVLTTLTPLEREVVIEIHVHGRKVAHVARSMGYSRGHISTVRRDAFRKLQPRLQDFREAA